MLISETLDGNEMYFCSASQIVGRHFIWSKISLAGSSGMTNIWVRLMNPDGTSPDGWSSEGTAVSTHTESFMDLSQLSAVITNNGLAGIWAESRNNASVMYGQLISPDGNRLWNSEGLAMSGSGVNDNNIKLLTDGNLLYCVWSESSPAIGHHLKIQSVDLAGNLLWGDYGTWLGLNGNQQYYPNLEKFDDGGFILSWMEDQVSEVTRRYAYINLEGDVIGSVYGNLIGNPVNYCGSAQIAARGNITYLAWSEHNRHQVHHAYYDDGFNDYFGLYLQKLNNELTPVPEEQVSMACLSMQQNCPNPFIAETMISFSNKQSAKVTLSIYNLKGQKINTLCDAPMDKGRHDFSWNGRDDNNKPVASGIYIYRLSSGKTSLSGKMILLR